MGIWIRSQNKELLVNADNMYYDHLFFANVENHYVNYSGKILGRYSTKEKALKVLDMIDDKILKIDRSKFFGFTEHCYENCIFQMPQDDEVEL